MAMPAWIDPAGSAGGPVLTTASNRLGMTGTLHWKTMPEALLEAGVSWKVYNDPTGLLGLSVLPYFSAYSDVLSLTGLELIAKGLTPTYPGTFASDVKSGSLPSVSWIIPPLADDENGGFFDHVPPWKFSRTGWTHSRRTGAGTPARPPNSISKRPGLGQRGCGRGPGRTGRPGFRGAPGPCLPSATLPPKWFENVRLTRERATTRAAK